MFAELFIDENFIETLDINLLTGKNFSRDFPADSSSSVLINETSLKMSGWDDPLGKEIIHIPAEGTDNYLTVVGVIKDIHFGKATRKVEPMVIHFDPRSNFLLIRTNGTQVEKTKEDLETIFKEIWEERNFRIFDFSEIFNNQFFNEINFANKIIVFASSAIFIACLGLFGLAVFITEQKTKEIGIWKVLGSSVRSVVFLLSKDFAKWVLLSNLIAWPLAYFAMNNWLQNFAYRTKINFWLFILSGMIALIISIITVSFQTIKAANADPVKSLKYE